LVYTGGVLQLTSGATKIFCEVSPCTITLTLPAGSSTPIYTNISSLTYDLSYSTITNIFTYSYTDSDDNAEGGRLLVKRLHLGNSTEATICDSSSTEVAAVLTCDITTQINGTYYAYGYVNRSSVQTLVNTLIIQKSRDIAGSVGADGLLWAVFLLIGVVMVGLYKPVIAMVFAIAGVITIGTLGIVSIPITAIITIILLGGVIIWGMRK